MIIEQILDFWDEQEVRHNWKADIKATEHRGNLACVSVRRPFEPRTVLVLDFKNTVCMPITRFIPIFIGSRALA